MGSCSSCSSGKLEDGHGRSVGGLCSESLIADLPMKGFSVLIIQPGFISPLEEKKKHMIWSRWPWLWSTSRWICQRCVALCEDRQYTGGHITRAMCLPGFHWNLDYSGKDPLPVAIDADAQRNKILTTERGKSIHTWSVFCRIRMRVHKRTGVVQCIAEA